jgi:hypothetical protein
MFHPYSCLGEFGNSHSKFLHLLLLKTVQKRCVQGVKMVTDFKGVWCSLKWAKKPHSVYVYKPLPAQIWAMFLWSLQDMLYGAPMHSKHHSPLRHTEVHTLFEIPHFIRIFWQAFSSHNCNTSLWLVLNKPKPLAVPTSKYPNYED